MQQSADEALRRIEQCARRGLAYDVLLVDWQMGDVDGLELLRRARGMLGGAMPPCLLITAFDDAEMWQRAREQHIDAVMLKPITLSALRDALELALQRKGPHSPVREAGTAEAELRRLHAGRRILLVEDNPINQEVALELLRSVGLVVEPAINGAQGLALALSAHHDLVLMDMQMPVMDGLEATRQIRLKLGSKPPIVAMTANAFGEDQMSCLAAGMNDHLAKPVEPERLYAMLLRWLSAPEAPEVVELPLAGNQPLRTASTVQRPLGERLAEVPGFSLVQGLSHVANKMDALVRVLRTFLASYRNGVPGLLEAVTRGDRAAIMTSCHSIRGACSTVGVIAAADLAAALELMAESMDVLALTEGAQLVHDELMTVVGRLALELGA